MLPPREGFSEETAGAIGSLVATLAGPDDIVLGHHRPRSPFPGRRFVQVEAPLLPGLSSLGTYARGVARTLARLRPSQVEVHNRPLVARHVARRFPGLGVSLFLHNDPRSMRGAGSARARAILGRRVRVVAVSRFLAALWGDDAVVLPNCIDLTALPPPAPSTSRARKVLFAGRVVADKGADVFVDAWARAGAALPGWGAEIIGADRFGEDSPETPFLAALRPRAASAGIVMTGYRTRNAVLAAMAEAAIVVVPSRWEEPFGLVALEAMASGAALVTTRSGGLPEIAGEAALYVQPGDAALLADAILALARDAGLRDALAARGLERAGIFDAAPARARLADFRQSQGGGRRA